MPWGYPKITKSRPYLIPIFQEKYDYFLYYFGHFLVKKGAWSHFKGLESKSHLPYCSVTTLGHISVQRVGPHHIPVLSLLVPKVVFFSISNHFFKFDCFYRYHAPILEKYEFDILVQNLILSRLTPNSNFQTHK